MTGVVLDASAVLALLGNEPGALVVSQRLSQGQCAISAVNVAEVAARLADRGMDVPSIAEAIDALGLDVRAFDSGDAIDSGSLRPPTRAFGLSLGDRACLALARAMGVPAITTDQVWTGLAIGVEVIVARPG